MKAKNKLKKKIFWGMFLIGVLETYAILVLCCFVALGHLDFRSWGLVIQSLACFVYAFIILFMPIFIVRLFTKSHGELTNKNMTNRYGLLYENLQISRGPKIYAQPLWFLLRRIILGFSVTWTSELLIVQIYLISSQTIVAVYILYYIKPFASNAEMRLEVFNEIILMLLLYMIICFSCWGPEIDVQYQLGYLAIALVIFHLFFHISIMFIASLRMQIRNCKIKRILQRYAKQRIINQRNIKAKRFSRRARTLKLRSGS